MMIIINRKFKWNPRLLSFNIVFQLFFYFFLYITLTIIYRIFWWVVVGFRILYFKFKNIIWFKFTIAIFINIFNNYIIQIECLRVAKHLSWQLHILKWDIFLTFIRITFLLWSLILLKYACVAFHLIIFSKFLWIWSKLWGFSFTILRLLLFRKT